VIEIYCPFCEEVHSCEVCAEGTVRVLCWCERREDWFLGDIEDEDSA